MHLVYVSFLCHGKRAYNNCAVYGVLNSWKYVDRWIYTGKYVECADLECNCRFRSDSCIQAVYVSTMLDYIGKWIP